MEELTFMGITLLPADFPNKNNTLTFINRELDAPVPSYANGP